MKKAFPRKHWIASGVASIVFVLFAITVIYYAPFDPKTRIALAALSITLLLMCFYFWQPQESGKEKTNYGVWITVIGVAWTFIGFGIGALLYRVSYPGLLTLQLTAWKNLGWMGPLAIGPFLVVVGLVRI